jgi:hypothetical protein
MVRDDLLQILYLSQLAQLLKASEHAFGKIMERCREMRMARTTKSKSLMVVPDGLLQIFYVAQLLKAGFNGGGEIIER